MAADKPQNVQDVFLNYIRKQKTPVTVFLVNGVKLQGIGRKLKNGIGVIGDDLSSASAGGQYQKNQPKDGNSSQQGSHRSKGWEQHKRFSGQVMAPMGIASA